MSSVAESRVAYQGRLLAFLPLIVLPVATALYAHDWPAWILMWALAFSIYAGLKWLSFAEGITNTETTFGRSLGYLLFWPGMNAKSFLASSGHVESPPLQEWLLAVAKTVLGLVFVAIAVRLVERQPMLAGWTGMTGIVFTLHFGLFHLLSLSFRRAGIDAPPIMDAPILSSSLSEFWGKRWNLAFRDLAHTFVFRPTVGELGPAGATMTVFFVSGVVHDAVISIPAGGGFGLPTLYFLIQGLGVLFEHSCVGQRLGTRKGATGRLFCTAVTVAPAFLLFHQPFVERVVVPMFAALGSL